MSAFDTFVVVDWSGGNQTAAAPAANAIWAATARDGVAEEPRYFRNRLLVEDWLNDLVQAELDAERRLCLCFDFPFAYPAGFAQALTGEDDPFNVWAWFAERVRDAPNTNNRFDLAGELNRALADGRGPFWGNGLARDIPGLPRTMADYANPFPSHRNAEELAPGAFTCWQMSGAGAVGGQVMMGLPVLHRLRRRFAPHVAAWPFEALDKPVALVEVWPSLIRETIAELRQPNEIPDRAQVRVLAQALSRLSPEVLGAMLNDGDALEGSILGLGHKDALRAAALNAQPLSPPPLRNDCFALPAGIDWTPVDDALALLRDRLAPVTGTEEVSLSDALGRVLAGDVTALRSNPPQANTAVDGYGFAGPALEGPHEMPLVPGRAAAGVPFAGRVPPGHAIRVLTGAALPEGVDTVILDEDTTTDGARIAFRGPLKQGANTRRAGEDMAAGDTALPAGRALTPADLALLAAVGVARVTVRKTLRVAVISTGDELVEAGAQAGPGLIFDANRPMLAGLLRRFGFDVLDMGRIADDRRALKKAFDKAAGKADAILTSGGASAGDEDHVSALLRQAGAMQEWRIAVKPGRPLALGLWKGRPVFGLPGNPVAAMVCTLVFARPALAVLSGQDWPEPQGFEVPAAFEKRKKPGRREYLRARIRDGRAEVFRSEGSGRISGLSWAEGLVEIGDDACHIHPGDPVRFIPYGSFGL